MGDAPASASDAKAFKKYSQMKLQTKREALTKLNRTANEFCDRPADERRFPTVGAEKRGPD